MIFDLQTFIQLERILYFPTQIEGEYSNRDARRDNYNGNRKETSAQKRSANRDRRRSYTDPNRSQAAEDRENARKREQARNRGNASTDPNDRRFGNRNFQRDRNARNRNRCATRGANCNYSGTSHDDVVVDVAHE
jgi:hypothetical protein